MKTSNEGIALIKQFEGFRGAAYKATPSEKYYTIGYGHYSADVKPGDMWSKDHAERVLKNDIAWCERAVAEELGDIPQACFDALVSFTFNLGPGNLKKLCKGRTMAEICAAIILYNKAGGKTLEGLTRRRIAEQALFTRGLSAVDHVGNIKKLQTMLNELGQTPPLVVDGICGNKTKAAVLRFMGVVIA